MKEAEASRLSSELKNSLAHYRKAEHKPYAFDDFVDPDMGSSLSNPNPYPVLRKPHDWVWKGKSKDWGKQKIDFCRFVYQKYPTPKFLDQAWLMGGKDVIGNKERRRTFRWWWVAVAQGKSLYKEHMKGVLTKRETHLFLKAPKSLQIEQAVWWARAMAESNDIGIAYRIATSRIGDQSYEDDWWTEVCRYFARNPVSLDEISHLCDYLHHARAEDENFTVVGRSLLSLRRRCEEWHRWIIKQKNIGGGSWEGALLPDWEYIASPFGTGKSNGVKWRMVQIKTGNDLAVEGRAMRHCVSSYKIHCIAGRTAIWSLLVTHEKGLVEKRALTVELRLKYPVSIIQAKGLANRSARSDELAILRKWAGENGVRLVRY